MVKKRISKRGWKGAVFGIFLAFVTLVTSVTAIFGAVSVYAVSDGVETVGEVAEDDGMKEVDDAKNSTVASSGDECLSNLGSIGWIVCPTTGKLAEAVDWIYGVIENFLVVNPIEMKDGTPIYEIWKYCRGVTNVVFIIFLLIVIYSQLTGLGISNYGIKKVLPKMIVVAVLVNLSFIVCSLAVDVSNIVGNSLRGMFTSVQETAIAAMAVEGEASSIDIQMSQVDLYGALAGGTTLAIGGTVLAIESGAIWMLIPVLLGAIVSVVTGLITIAMRQAVVALLIMVAPLAIVAYMLPNTEQWFTKWRKLLMQMLMFYPMFAVLFGASQLAGFAIIASANNAFGVILGAGVQVFPLFFSWKLMKTAAVVGTIGTWMQRMMAKPLETNRAWADSHRQLTKANYLAKERAVTPSLYLRQFLANRKVERETDTAEKNEMIKNRGLAYRARRNYDWRGLSTRRGEEAYEDIARNLEYQRIIARDKNNLDKGLGALEATKKYASEAQKLRLGALDTRVMNAADYLNVEQARGKVIEYENAVGLHERLNKAINAHMDEQNGYEMHDDEYILDRNGNRIRNEKYRLHEIAGSKEFNTAKNRYDEVFKIMEGNTTYAQFAAADASVMYDTQAKILKNTMLKYLELTPPTRDVEYRLSEITMRKDAAKYIDAIIPGMQILNQRGDTDLLQIQLDNVLTGGKNRKALLKISGQVKDIKADTSLSEEEKQKAIEELYKNTKLDTDVSSGETEHVGVQLGTHASQALAGFLMFDVKDNDPFLRRFGKYINLETANAFNANKRQELNVTYDEYIRGYHLEPDGELMYAKRGMKELMEGTSLDNMERTAMSNFDTRLRMAYRDEDNNLDADKFFEKRKEIETAIAPQLISASLKYLSGSEQLRSLVKFKTGFDYRQKKEIYVDSNGVQKERVVLDEHGNPVYIWEPTWAEGRDDFSDKDREKARAYFEEQTLKYITDQTTSQVANLRSDYYTPLLEHLSHAYLNDAEMDEWSPEEATKRREYLEALSEIQTRYGDLPAEEAEKRRKADKAAFIKEHKDEWAGSEFRKILDKCGKLNHIYTLRRSGVTSGMKDWERRWLDLDNEVKITQKLEEDKKKQKEQLKEQLRKGKKKPEVIGAEDENIVKGTQIYSELDKALFVSHIDDLWRDLRAEDDEVFYEESLAYIVGNLGENSVVAKKYERFHKDEPNEDSHSMKEHLIELLGDPENY